MRQTIKIRPHHMLCMLTYIGKGYSEAFIQNYSRIIDDINNNRVDLLLVEGPDDICAPRLCDESDKDCHCNNQSINNRDRIASQELGIQIGHTVHPTEDLIKSLRTAYKSSTIRTACIGCEWKDLCDKVAQDDFKGTKLK